MTTSPVPLPFLDTWKATKCDASSGITPSLPKWRKTTNIALILCAFSASMLSAQTLTVLHNFHNTDGSYPWGGLVQAANGDFYGTASGGGANSQGVVFKITPGGVFSTVYNFCSQGGTACTDGEQPRMGLILDGNGYLYGTTLFGGANNRGTLYRITQSGELTTLYSFCNLASCADGWAPYGVLLQAHSGGLYGTTNQTGMYNSGTIFDSTPAGGLTTLYSFCATLGCPDGAHPSAGLIQAGNGILYGTTTDGGANCSNDSGCGTVFKLIGATETVLYSFCSEGGSACTDGSGPNAGLVLGPNGNFFGVTPGGGLNNNSEGTVFKITPSGTLTTLHSFCTQTGCPDGQVPLGGLILASDGNFYGTTSGGFGTIYQITPRGALTTLAAFDNTNGSGPYAAPVQGTNGDFYGTTNLGGAHGYGTVYRLSTGLAPFVKTVPTSGTVGAAVKILGYDLTGATSVSFNGTAAVFTVVSGAEIITTVPSGATTGTVQVVTPTTTLTSNVAFDVLP
jgi:uncharacterized repeat protein (TIGR03803 family)